MKDKTKKKQRSKDDGPWFWINRGAIEDYGKRVGAGAFGLYNAYCCYAYGKKQIVWPSMATLMEMLNITKPTLIKYNVLLEKHRLIKIDKSDGTTNRITLLKIKGITGSKNSLPVKILYRTSKNSLPLPVKILYSNKKKYNKKKEEYNSGSSAGSRLKKKMLKGCIPSDRDSFDIFTDELIIISQSKNKVMKRPDRTQWKRQFILLHTKDGIDKKIIRSMIKWYKKHIGESFVPDIRTAGGFRKKFDQLIAAKERHKKAEEKGEVESKVRRVKKGKKRRME